MLPRTVIIALDGSRLAETALEPGLALAQGLGADLVLARATWHQPPEAEERYLQRLADELDITRDAAAPLIGFAATAVTELVQATDDALLCLSTRGHTGVGELVLGSTAADIMSRTSDPVVLVGPACTGTRIGSTGSTLVLCFDDSPAVRGLEATVVDWATKLTLDVRIVTVLHRDGEFLGNTPSADVRRAGADLVGRLQAAGLTAEHVLLDGLDPARAIADDAAGGNAALIVAGATSRHDSAGAAHLARAVLGSTAERVVRHAVAPVLIARG